MQLPINEKDKLLQATSPRLEYVTTNYITVVSSGNTFTKKSDGFNPSDITLNAIPTGSLRGVVTWNSFIEPVGGVTELNTGLTPLTVGTILDNNLKLTPEDIQSYISTSGTTTLSVVATLDYLGLVYKQIPVTLNIYEQQGILSLTSDSITVTTNTDGSAGVGAYINATTTASIFVEDTDDQANWTFSWSYDNLQASATITPDGRTIQVTNIIPEVDTITFTVTAQRDGWTSKQKTYIVSKSKQGYVGNDSITVDLDQDVDVVIADEFGQNYSYPATANYIRLIKGSTQVSTGVVYSGTATKNGLTLTVNSSTGQITLSGTWTSQQEEFIVSATYETLTYNKTYSIFKSIKGSSAVFVNLTSESDLVPCTEYGSGYTLPTGNQIELYRGGVIVTSGVTYSVNGAAQATLNGLTASVNSNGVITLTGSTWTQDQETFTFTATLSGVNYNINYKIVKVKQGIAQKLVYLTTSSPVVVKTKTNSLNPTTLTFSAYSRIGNDTATTQAYSGRFKIYTNGSATATYTSAVDESTKQFTVTTSMTQIKCELYQANGTTVLLDVDNVNVIAEGENGISVDLSNDQHIISADQDGVASSYAGSGTEIRVYSGADLLVYDGIGTSNGTWKVTAVGTNITPGSFTDSGSYVTVGQHAGMADASDYAYITYTITGKNSTGVAFTSTVQQSFTKTRFGEDAYTVDLDSDTDVISANEFGLGYTLPTVANYIRLMKGSTQVTSQVTYSGTATKNGLTLTVNSSTGQITLSGTNWTTETESFAVTATYRSVPYTKTYTLSKSVKGSQAVFIDLTDDSQLLPTTENGTGYTLPTGNQILLYRGGELITTGVTYNVEGLAQTTKGGLTLAVNSTTGVITLSGTSWTTDNENFTLRATLGGVTYSIVYSITKVKQGITATVYYMTASTPVIVKNKDGTLSPTTVTFNAYQKVGNNTPTAYSGKFKIYINGSGTATYTTSTTESSKTYTVQASDQTILCGLYDTTGATVLDQYSVNMVEDGANGLSAVLSNDSHVFPAGSDGAVQSYANSGTEIRVYQGADLLSYDGLGTSNGTWKITTTPTNITVGSLTDSGSYLTVGQHSGVAAGTDTSKISYSITGKDLQGNSFSITKDQTFTKSKQGTTGDKGPRTATIYFYYNTATGTAPTQPTTAQVSYNFSTNAATITASGWSNTLSTATITGQNGANNKYWAIRVVFSEATFGGTQNTPVIVGPFTWINFDGLVTFTNLANATDENGNVSATLIDGAQIKTGTITAGKINAQGLQIYDTSGNLIINAGVTTGNIDFAKVGGTTKTTLLNDVSTAQSTATTAQSTANTAQSTANTAQSTANTAQSTANTANTTANSAYQLATTANNGLATKLSNESRNVLQGSAGLATGTLNWDTTGTRTSGYGIGITAKGIVGYNSSGINTFSIDGTNGNASFAGTLAANIVSTSNIQSNAVTVPSSALATSNHSWTTTAKQTLLSVAIDPSGGGAILIAEFQYSNGFFNLGDSVSATFYLERNGTAIRTMPNISTGRYVLTFADAGPINGSTTYALTVTTNPAATVSNVVGLRCLAVLGTKR